MSTWYTGRTHVLTKSESLVLPQDPVVDSNYLVSLATIASGDPEDGVIKTVNISQALSGQQVRLAFLAVSLVEEGGVSPCEIEIRPFGSLSPISFTVPANGSEYKHLTIPLAEGGSFTYVLNSTSAQVSLAIQFVSGIK